MDYGSTKRQGFGKHTNTHAQPKKKLRTYGGNLPYGVGWEVYLGSASNGGLTDLGSLVAKKVKTTENAETK